jgi:hypothetical protein
MKTLLFSATAAVAALGSVANANTLDRTGSLLLFPFFDNTRGAVQAFTVTNTSADASVRIEYVYINETDCLEFNRTRTLTPNDTVTTLSNLDNPNMARGYLYVFAKNAAGQAITFNNLAGATVVSTVNAGLYEAAPIVFQGLTASNASTDTDSDGLRDLNGTEYSRTPDELIVPRFFGAASNQLSGTGSSTPTISLINLSGGASFTAIVDFLVYNDNEEVFSAQTSFSCYKRMPLAAVNSVFTSSFLASTNDDDSESVEGIEMGWYRLDGRIAFSSTSTYNDPAIIAAHLDILDGSSAGVLPYGVGEQSNGDLVVLGPSTDNN